MMHGVADMTKGVVKMTHSVVIQMFGGGSFAFQTF